jgi:hypothetical protein
MQESILQSNKGEQQLKEQKKNDNGHASKKLTS